MKSLYFDNIRNTKNFEDIPVRGLNFLLKKLHIYDLFERYARDGRQRRGPYTIASLLMVGLEMLLFRSPSKNDFYQNQKLGRGACYRNLGKIACIKKGGFPHCKTIDDAFLSLDSTDLEPILFDIFNTLRLSKLFSNHPSLKRHGSLAA